MFWSWRRRDVAVDELEDRGKLVVDAVAAGEVSAGGERDPGSW